MGLAKVNVVGLQKLYWKGEQLEAGRPTGKVLESPPDRGEESLSQGSDHGMGKGRNMQRSQGVTEYPYR